MNIGTIIHKKAGFLIPAAMFTAALTAKKSKDGIVYKPSVAGYAIQAKDDEGKPFLHVETGHELPTIENLNLLQEKAKDFNVLFYIGSGEYPEHTVMPYHLSGDDETIFLTMACEGDFPKYAGTEEGAFPEAANVMGELVVPTISKFLQKNETSDLHAELEDSLFMKNLENSVAHRGDFAFMMAEGDVIRITKDNALGESFDWGFTSNTHGYSEAVADQEPVDEVAPQKKAFSLFGGSKKPAAVAAPPAKTEKPVVAAKSSVPSSPVTKKTETAAVVHDLKKGQMHKIPSERKLKNKIKWYAKVTGKAITPEIRELLDKGGELYIPNADLVTPVIANTQPIKSLSEIPKDQVKTSTSAAAVNAAKPTLAAKNPAAEEANMFTLGIEEKGKLVKFQDVNANDSMKPEDFHKLEEKYSSFSKQSGINVEKTFFWSPKKIWEFSGGNKAVFLLILELRGSLMAHYTLEDLAGTAKEEKEAPAVNTEVANDKPVGGKKSFSLFGKKNAA